MTHPVGGSGTGPGREIAIPGLTSPFDAVRRIDTRGEYWTARDLMPLLGYEKWERLGGTNTDVIAASAA